MLLNFSFWPLNIYFYISNSFSKQNKICQTYCNKESEYLSAPIYSVSLEVSKPFLVFVAMKILSKTFKYKLDDQLLYDRQWRNLPDKLWPRWQDDLLSHSPCWISFLGFIQVEHKQSQKFDDSADDREEDETNRAHAPHEVVLSKVGFSSPEIDKVAFASTRWPIQWCGYYVRNCED